ncbi:MAG: histidine triad nucleotide-binding protein [Candidatus Sungbacteria bacterium RIFCSPLOWO2_02_FULL_51_17]|uniref:Histidine triad nucleotide-binding protein n=1 Tax=Candidatus Sungbacteria bacterium RIFCSPHIGHO2_02_FULL_51_29 TaxID=1802273 RepID=A0A1G2KUW7_9BACT|nr:MAG: histidine triad nucleotide-binding protein [Candidatus Sungbacteria bacterium RIFCSPHIGHO2_01_FULL_51_22]OHA02251.1 MAG: histidine triad nucleotide-binding protein [Candidatus Sungbacteria bacterium RIFCSPHIGHO2_02_FULL_51_29]OHA06662.1 MAG: histidine triad nucleotide-binding protein [Candidatus Sungbacteria bacterium RIFCSPLOWO2_01_FULL_51_34]OHA11232.1 MAG: histidine triad nucleotide-binding protein [Candidatus Sungbacteria bacterium RIFCSPLOWO2_02_FULL_51_17]
MDCIFCKIIQKEVPSDVFYENDDVFVFNDMHPKAPVHLLVIPKVHIQSIAHLEDGQRDIIGDIFLAARDMARKKGLVGYKLLVNVGHDGGQIIDHLHIHLLGGWERGGKAGISI